MVSAFKPFSDFNFNNIFLIFYIAADLWNLAKADFPSVTWKKCHEKSRDIFHHRNFPCITNKILHSRDFLARITALCTNMWK